jgi:iron complex transport system substrate-binding protein
MRSVRPWAAAVAALLLILTTAACGERAEPISGKVSLYPVAVTDAGGRPVRLRERPLRILPLTPAAARTLAALGVRGRIVTASERPSAQGSVPSTRTIKRVRPDLIVASPRSDSRSLARATGATGAVAYTTRDDSLREVERSISQLGLLVGRPLAARRIVASLEARRRTVERAVATRRRARVFFDMGVFVTVSSRSLIGDLIGIAGGENVAGSRPEPGPFDLNQLLRLDPDVYVATLESGTSLRDLRKNRKTRRLSAVRTSRFGVVPARLLQPGPRVGEGLLALARLLHPDAFR